MVIVHYIAQFVQFASAIALIMIVMSQTSKEQGLGGTLGGGDGGGGGSRYRGGFEEKLDNTARNLAYFFLGISLFVAWIGQYAY